MSQAAPSLLSSAEAPRLLSQPFTLRGTTIRNRLAKSAMSEALGERDGAPGPGLPVLYRRWAEGGLGLVITGNVMVDHRALGEPGNVVIEDDRHLDALRRWAQAGTAGGTQLWMQLNHPGKQAPRGLNRETVSPSAVPFPPQLARFFATPRELRTDEIEDIVQRFARAARVAQQAGFSGVQIHGAHGYLVSQFLSPKHNIRTDEWGGTPEKRRRFVLAVLAAMRAQVGPDFPIGIKLNSADFQRGGFTEEESLDTVRALEAAGIDLIEISGGTYEAPAMTGIRQQARGGSTGPGPVRESTRQREAYFLEFAEKARAAVKVPLMVTGGFRTPQGMADALASGAVDFVGLARSLALEPDVGLRLLAGQPGRHTVKLLKTGIGAIDRMGLLEVSWYTRQLHRIAAGQPPVPDESPLKVFLITAWKMMRGKGPRKLRA